MDIKLKTKRYIYLFLTAIIMSGCSSNNVIRTSDLATAGKEYAAVNIKLLDEAIGAGIKRDNREIKTQQIFKNKFEKPSEDKEAKGKALKEFKSQNKEQIQYIANLYKSQEVIRAIGKYFETLEELASSPNSEDIETSISSLSGQINSLNVALKRDRSSVMPILGSAQRQHVSNLGKLVTNEIHGNKLANILRRDAKIIGDAIAYQDAISNHVKKNIIRPEAEFQLNKNKKKVLTTFKNNQLNTPSWSLDRENYIKAKAKYSTLKKLTNKTIDDQNTAKESMLTAWQDILTGKLDTLAIRNQVENTEDILNTLALIKTAEKPTLQPVNLYEANKK